MAITLGRRLSSWFSLWPFNRERGEQLSGPMHEVNEADVPLTDERKLQISTVFSCIRLLTEAIGSLSLAVYERTGSGRRFADEHRVARLLREPNPLMTGQQLIEALAMQLVGWGNAYDLKARNSLGEVIELWPLSPSSMKVDRVDFDRVLYKYSHPDRTEEYEQGRILHVKGFGGDGLMGLSPLSYSAQALGITVASERYSASFFKKGGRPSGVLEVEKQTNPKQREEIRQNYLGLTGGSEDHGNGLWVLPAFAKYQPISISPEDAQLLVTRQFQVGEIARIFRVPLFLLMEMEKSTSWGTGLEQQNIAFLTYTLRPYLTRIEGAMNRALFSEKERGRFYVEFNVESLLRGDSKARAEFYSTMVQNGLMSRNEVREKENLAAFKGGEVFTAQTNLAPVDMLGEIAKKPEPKPAEPPSK